MKLSILIPALNPDESLVNLVEALGKTPVEAIIVVNDGSSPEFDEIFGAVKCLPKVCFVRHSVNVGKGAALKTGINYFLCNFPDHVGVVTADADGQHRPEDILRVANRLLADRDALIIGARAFSGYVPLRSKVGNAITRIIAPIVIGQRVTDTQSGLRGIPRLLLPHLLKIRSNGYEFELDMLIVCKQHSCRVLEEKIQTIYEEGNKSSHFNPVLDSMRIYFVLFRFTFLSMLTALIDNVVFYMAFGVTANILRSQICGRFIAVIFNYTAVRKVAFLSEDAHLTVLPKYLLLVVGSGAVSYGFIRLLISTFPLPVLPAKVIAESLIFIANFAIQRDFIFTKRKAL
jgi:glycosyltransferase involved in cell wall biosynthesis